MIIWLVFMFFYSFGRRAPTSSMMTFAAVAGVVEVCVMDILVLMHLVSSK